MVMPKPRSSGSQVNLAYESVADSVSTVMPLGLIKSRQFRATIVMFAFVVILSSCLGVPREGPVLEAALDFPAPPSARDFAGFPARRFYLVCVKRSVGDEAIARIVSRQTKFETMQGQERQKRLLAPNVQTGAVMLHVPGLSSNEAQRE